MNVHRHSHADRVKVSLTATATAVILRVQDNGTGVSAAQLDRILTHHAGGVGLAGIKARLDRLGGSLEVCSDGKGFELKAVAPIDGTRSKA
jgi:signal transduction histidine kinase